MENSHRQSPVGLMESSDAQGLASAPPGGAGKGAEAGSPLWAMSGKQNRGSGASQAEPWTLANPTRQPRSNQGLLPAMRPFYTHRALSPQPHRPHEGAGVGARRGQHVLA